MKCQFIIKILFILGFLIIKIISLQSQVVTDYDGNIYQTVTIGNQIWMVENLKVTHYSDGTPISCGTGLGQIDPFDSSRYYFYYNDNPSYINNYGLLYTWITAMNRTNGSETNPSSLQGVCPSGWHIPSDAEWQELEIFLGMDSIMAKNPSCWESDRINNLAELLKVGGTSGFEAKYSGNRDIDGTFNGLGGLGEFITSNGERYGDDPIDTYTRLYYILNIDSKLFCHYHNTNAAYSVRCIKDAQSPTTTPRIYYSYINLYPNPAKDFIYIDAKDIKIDFISIYSLQGMKQECKFDKDNNKIMTTYLDKGMYLLRSYNKNSVFINKIIIE
jgi:uncharacterized protein (TIGR02145 family)